MKILQINRKKAALGLMLMPLLLFFGTAGGQLAPSLDVPFVPTPEEVVEAMLDMAEINENDVLYDLGCGDGRIVITAAKKFGCRGVGIDLDPARIRECQVNAAAAGVEDLVRFRQMDLFDADFSPATVVTLYLLSEVNLKLRPRLLRELSPGTRVVSHDFDMGEWAADKETFIGGDWNVHAVYCWKIPANISGTWRCLLPNELGKKSITFKFDQLFQTLKGKFSQGTLRFPSFVEEATIDGSDLHLVLERRPGGVPEKLVFEGTAEGHKIQGTVRKEGDSAVFKWTAKRNPASMKSIDGEFTPLY